jgi:hypothetical protein
MEDDILFAERRYGPAGDRIEYARLLREAAGASAGDWVMSEQPERDAIHVRGLLRLIWAAGCRLFAYFDMPEFSPDRSEVLLAGAGKLGVKTDWKGWT